MHSPEAMKEHWAWEHRKNIPPDVQHAVLERDSHQCQLCGTGGENRLQLHHWLSFRSHGGPHIPENLVTLCHQCHEQVHRGEADVLLLEIQPNVWATFPAMPRRR